jgi:hypothetical protein
VQVYPGGYEAYYDCSCKPRPVHEVLEEEFLEVYLSFFLIFVVRGIVYVFFSHEVVLILGC